MEVANGGAVSAWPVGAPWVLGTFTEKKTCEGDVFGSGANDCESGEQAKEQFCFASSTGQLLRRRVLVGNSPGASDLLEAFT